ncbi:MAG: exopolysaccharide biosynthesis polyprenyl glycosylphosphotransferase [Bryobacterales bacterium]|jgi:Undecaprenyl-phosphate galactose phosphotransferase WbaP|nr:exopolysaccharide biosynthesis polyprenyl glycosylphosphotransferase [Bryobacterales bacterium]
MASRLIDVVQEVEAAPVRSTALPSFPTWEQRTQPPAPLLKRAFDIAAACFFIPLVLPLSLLIALAIRLESPGPVLFRHTRIGKGNRRFTLWKFRSMLRDSEQRLQQYLRAHPELASEWHASHKLKNDPRITRVGRFLRRTSLDELPQFWNVLVGDMSLIGPRPIVDAEVPKYGPAGFRVYTRVRPGLTGLWQVSGRSDTSYARRVELDTRYIRQWSIGMDLRIIWKTIGVILRANGAY